MCANLNINFYHVNSYEEKGSIMHTNTNDKIGNHLFMYKKLMSVGRKFAACYFVHV